MIETFAIIFGIIGYLLIGFAVATIGYICDKKNPECIIASFESMFVIMWPIIVIGFVFGFLFCSLETLGEKIGDRILGRKE